MTGRDRATVAWVRRRISPVLQRVDVPPFGSSAWLALDDTDPRKSAAVLRAALCWWDESRPERIAERLHDEFAVREQLEARAFAEMAAQVRAMADTPTWAEVQQRWAS